MSLQLLPRKYWTSDSSTTLCYECRKAFSLFNRKHHCRMCGQIFCGNCSAFRLPGERFSVEGPVRVCKFCYNKYTSQFDSPAPSKKIVHETNSSNNLTATEKQNIKENNRSWSYFKENNQRSAASDIVWTQSGDSPLRESDASNTMYDSDGAESTVDENLLVKAVRFNSANSPQQTPLKEETINNVIEEDLFNLPRSTRRTSAVASFMSLFNGKKTPVPKLIRRQSSFSLKMVDKTSLNTISWANMGYEDQLLFRSEQYLMKLLNKVVTSFELAPSWVHILCDISKNATTQLINAPGSNPMKHVKIFRVTGGADEDSMCINGIAFPHRVAHKHMRTKIRNPRLLLIACALEFERIQGKFSELYTIYAQEEEYLLHLTEKIISLKPDIVLLQQNISRIALNRLLEAKITVIANVPHVVLEKIAAVTGSTILNSLTELVVLPANPAVLATPNPFAIFGTNTFKKEDDTIEHFLVLEGSKNQFGCSIILRGEDMELLTILKRILLFDIYARYNMRLETSFLAEEGATSQFLENIIQSLPTSDATHSLSQSLETITQPNRIGKGAHRNMQLISGIDQSCVNAYKQLQTLLKSGQKVQSNIQLLSCSPNIYYPPRRDISSHSTLKRWPALCIPSSFLVPNFIDNAFTTSYMVTRQRAKYNYPSLFKFKKVKELAPMNQQSIQYLHSLCCRDTGNQCIPFAIHRIDFYGSTTDLPMAKFFRDYCFVDKPCDVCSQPLMTHDRSIIHGRGRINITLEKASEYLKKIENESEIICWSSCPNCELTTQFTTMSKEALDYSFGKWLEHMFYYQGNPQLGSCSHSITREHIRYYMHQNIVAAVSYEVIPFYTVLAPPLYLQYYPESREKIYQTQVSLIESTLTQIYDTIQTQIEELEETLKKEDDLKHLEELRCSVTEERDAILKRFELTKELGKEDEHELNRFKQNIFVNTTTWNSTLQALYYKRVSSTVTRRAVLSSAQAQRDMSQNDPIFIMYSVSKKQRVSLLSMKPSLTSPIELMPELGTQPNKPIGRPRVSSQRYFTDGPPLVSQNDLGARYRTTTLEIPSKHGHRKQSSVEYLPLSQSVNKSASTGDLTAKKSSKKRKSSEILDTFNDEPAATSTSATEFTNLFGEEESQWNSHIDIDFTQLGRSPSRGGLVTSSKSKVNTNSTVDSLAKVLPNLPPGVTPGSLNSSALRDASGLFFKGTENAVITVSEKEPCSMLAHALMTSEYKQFVATKRQEILKQDVSSELEEKYVPLVSDLTNNIEIVFKSSHESKTIRCTVTIFFAAQFHALRELSIPEDVFINSISHSESWDASGGKSGSSWEKTLDERFVIKRLPKVESEAFISVGPLYFKYLAKAHCFEVPTMLAKILGVFTINYRSGHKSIKQDVVVMENLFYNRKVTRIYDLKGSLRNRLISETENTAVLLDENLLNDMFQYPLCVDEHSKALITLAVWNDSLFLSSLYVMDYSLIVGIDEENQELVIGIVDYIRQYTLDKQIEKFVKSQQGSQLPTVIAPKDYKERFRTAMWNYFVMVPSKFTRIVKPSDKSKKDQNSWEEVLKSYDANRSQSSRGKKRN